MLDWSVAYITLKDSTGASHDMLIYGQGFLLALRNHLVPRDIVANYDQTKDNFAQEEQRQNKKNWQYRFPPDEQRNRDAFDVFLGRLERIESLIKNGVISKSNFADHFSYWLKLMDENKPEKLSHFSDAKRIALWNYIRDYEFNGVIKLFARFGRAK
jgi:CRISPR/Cas system-associated endonuclease/helicase Cas3